MTNGISISELNQAVSPAAGGIECPAYLVALGVQLEMVISNSDTGAVVGSVIWKVNNQPPRSPDPGTGPTDKGRAPPFNAADPMSAFKTGDPQALPSKGQSF